MGLFLTRRVVVHFAVWLGVAVMAGCGGGGGDPPPAAVAPTIASQPAAYSVTAGLTASFNVTASGTAPLAYQWRRGGVDIAGANAASYTTPATVIGDNGVLFSVVVTNASGSVTSASATLTVSAAAAAPSITGQPAAVTVAVGTTASFSVTAIGSAPLAYQWRRNGSDIPGATAPSYTTPATTLADDGSIFTVRISNGAGAVVSASATLTVGPAAPTSYPYYVAIWSSNDLTAGSGSYTLSVVDPATPGRMVTIDVVPRDDIGAGTILRVRGGSYDAASGELSNVGVRQLVYVKRGSLYRLNLEKGGGVPAPVRVTDETAARGNLTLVAQSHSGDDAFISYATASGAVRYVRLGDAATASPRSNPIFPGDPLTLALVSFATDAASGAITSLVWNSARASGGTRLFRTNPDFGSPTGIATFASNVAVVGPMAGVLTAGRMRGGVIFVADGNLYRLDLVGSGGVRELAAGVGGLMPGRAADDTHVYLRTSLGGTMQLLRAPDADSGSAQVIASGAAAGAATDIVLQTRDYLVLVSGSTGENAVSVRKADGLATPLPAAPPNPPFTTSWTVLTPSFHSITAGNRVFYSHGLRFGSVLADGTDRKEHAGSFISTGGLPARVRPHMLHVNDLNTPAARGLLQDGRALHWIDFGTGDRGETVGNAPAANTAGNASGPFKDWSIGAAGYLGWQRSVNLGPGSSVDRLDAFFVTDQADSLQRLTNFIP